MLTNQLHVTQIYGYSDGLQCTVVETLLYVFVRDLCIRSRQDGRLIYWVQKLGGGCSKNKIVSGIANAKVFEGMPERDIKDKIGAGDS